MNSASGRKMFAGQRGFSLVELLVAVLLLSIGLLGLAGLQTTSLQMNQSAHYASQAHLFAQEIAEAVIANPSAARAGRYDFSMDSEPPGGDSIAEQDLRRWIEGIRAALPMRAGETGGSVAVTGIGPGGGHRITVNVAWLDARWEEDGEEIRTITVETEL